MQLLNYIYIDMINLIQRLAEHLDFNVYLGLGWMISNDFFNIGLLPRCFSTVVIYSDLISFDGKLV
jgi:hypothetical protein